MVTLTWIGELWQFAVRSHFWFSDYLIGPLWGWFLDFGAWIFRFEDLAILKIVILLAYLGIGLWMAGNWHEHHPEVGSFGVFLNQAIMTVAWLPAAMVGLTLVTFGVLWGFWLVFGGYAAFLLLVLVPFEWLVTQLRF